MTLREKRAKDFDRDEAGEDEERVKKRRRDDSDALVLDMAFQAFSKDKENWDMACRDCRMRAWREVKVEEPLLTLGRSDHEHYSQQHVRALKKYVQVAG